MPGISVVVASYNRVELLKQCLQALLQQAYPDFEIIVVNDGSNDETKSFLDGLQNPKIKIIHHRQNLGPSESRNLGIHVAQHELIAFTDDDCLPRENWLAELVRGFGSEASFVFGQTIYVKQGYRGNFPERIIENLSARWPMGNNLCCRKAVFETVGYFDSQFDYYHNEDSEMAIRAANGGFKFRPVPTAVVFHQKTFWTANSLWRSARNPAVWTILKKKYPDHYLIFGPPIKLFFINPEDYLQIILMPILLPLLFVRFIFNGQKNFKLFFTKWPLYPFLRRFYIYREALRQKVFVL